MIYDSRFMISNGPSQSEELLRRFSPVLRAQSSAWSTSSLEAFQPRQSFRAQEAFRRLPPKRLHLCFGSLRRNALAMLHTNFLRWTYHGAKFATRSQILNPR